jgi:hypothetical protein
MHYALSMTDPDNIQSIEDLYALIERDRIAAEALAQRVFLREVKVAVGSITDVTAVASTRIMTDTQVASAKIQMDSEVMEARLLVSGEIAATEIEVARERGAESAHITQLATDQAAQLSDTARQLIDSMVAEAEAAVAKIRQIGEDAINEIHSYALDTTARMRASDTAAARMNAYKAEEHSVDDIVAEGAKAANFVTLAAESALLLLQKMRDDAVQNIRAATDKACTDIKDAVERAAERIGAARIKAQARIDAAALAG